jgi:anti-sigma regulatory factor (Ser/Thr protein kinase)
MGARESKSGLLSCGFRGGEAIHAATQAAHAFSANECLAQNDAARLCIVIEELVTNLLDHGGVAQDDIIELKLARGADGITIVLIDPGMPFDLRTADRSSAANPDRGGGAGIDMVRAWTTILGYQSLDGQNRLKLLMPLGRKSLPQ